MGKHFGKTFYLERHRITLDESGNGTKPIKFEAKLGGTPYAKCIPTSKTDSGTFTPASLTSTGCTITVSSSDSVSQDVYVDLFVLEY